MSALQTRQQTIRALSPAQAFPTGTSKLQLLSNLSPEKKLPEARTQSLSKEARVVYLATYKEGMTAMQALDEANRRSLTLAPLKDFDERLNGTGQIWQVEAHLYPAWTGTFLAYADYGIPLGKTIRYTDSNGVRFVFPVPRKVQGRTNFALAINHGFTKDGKPLISFKKISEKKFLIEIPDESKLKIIEHLPAWGNWRLPENEFGIPTGLITDDKNPMARHLCRSDYAYAGFTSVGYDGFYDIGGGRSINAGGGTNGKPNYRLGVLAYTSQK